MATFTTSVVRFTLTSTLCATLAAAPCAGRSAEKLAAGSPLATWVREKGLTMGFNAKTGVFVTRGAGRGRLECLVSALRKASTFLKTDVVTNETVAEDETPARITTTLAVNRLLGYDIASKATVAHRLTPQLEEDSDFESLTIVSRNGDPLCMTYENVRNGDAAVNFYPTLDEPSRAAIEKELFAAFVRDFCEHRPEGKPWVECVFVIELAPRQQPKP